MARTQKYFIGPQLLGDIRRVVGRVEAQPYGSDVTRVETRLQDMQRPRPEVVRSCSWTGTWNRGYTNTINVIASTASGGRTAVAVNDYFGWRDNGSIGTGVVLKQGGVWRLKTIDLETVQGYTSVSSVTPPAYGLLGMELVYGDVPPGAGPERWTYLKWFEVTSCATQA
jgi:hypothetical protein